MSAGATARSGPSSLATPAARADGRGAWRWLALGLLVVDALAVEAAFALAYVIRFKQGLPFLQPTPHSLAFYIWVAYWALPVWLTLFALYRMYDWGDISAPSQELFHIVSACSAGTVAVIVISFLDVGLLISRGWLLLTWLLAIVLVWSVRLLVRRLLQELRRRGHLAVSTVIVGTNAEAHRLAEQLLAEPLAGLTITGFIDPSLAPGTAVLADLAVLGNLNTLSELVRQGAVREIVVATSALDRSELLDLYQSCGYEPGVKIRLSSGLFEVLTTGVRVQDLGGFALMTPQRVRITGVDAVLKAAVDYLGAACGLALLWPILLVVAMLIKIDSPGPVLHRRRVLGVGGKPFDAFKFRTMVANADQILANDAALRQAFEAGYKMRSDPRITGVGRFLRRASVDELPQLFNVLRGEMSLVGPRMVAPDEASRYGQWQLSLLTVKPGITGPWQVRGRNTLVYEERVRLSMQYIRNYSIWLDLALLVRTIPVVVLGKGAY